MRSVQTFRSKIQRKRIRDDGRVLVKQGETETRGKRERRQENEREASARASFARSLHFLWGGAGGGGGTIKRSDGETLSSSGWLSFISCRHPRNAERSINFARPSAVSPAIRFPLPLRFRGSD